MAQLRIGTSKYGRRQDSHKLIDMVNAAVSLSSNTAKAKQTEAFSQMQGSVSKYARANDRRMVLRSMRDVKYLKCVPLENPAQPSRENLRAYEEELVMEESIILNGVPFHGSQHFLTTLRELCCKLCEQEGVWLNADDLYDELVTRMARSTSSADSFFKLNSLVGSPDLMLLPTTQKQSFPIKLNVYVSAGEIHTNLSTTNAFGLFRKTDVKPTDLMGGPVSSRPWIVLHATVDERANISSNKTVRHARVLLPESLY